MSDRQRIVIVGNGNAGAALVNSLLAKDSENIQITLYGGEEVGTYDRVRLSEYMAGSVDLENLGMRSDDWYEEQNVDFRRGVLVERIDTKGQRVRGGADGEWVPYDHLVLATGSSSSVPPIEGRDKKGVFVFRTVRDVEEMLEASPERAVVIGGGLLGLEAAYGLLTHDAEVTVLHRAGHLMNQQLDPPAGRMLRSEIEKLGVGVRVEANTEEILGNGKVQGVRLKTGEFLPADMVVICTGITPNTKPAGPSGIRANNGILVDEHMRTSAKNVYAVGECTEFNGQLIGLVAPALEQVRVVVDTILGDGETTYKGSGAATKLKVAGVDLNSVGDAYGRDEGCESIVSSNPLTGVYKKAVIKDGKIIGAILLGDVSTGPQLTDAVKRGADADEVADWVVGTSSDVAPLELSDDAQVCDCNGVSKGQIVATIQDLGLKKVSEVVAETKAGNSCGSCKPLVGQILQESAESVEEDKSYLCKCMELTHDDLKAVVSERGLRSVSEVGEACGAGKVCPDCKVGVTYIVSEVNANRHTEERHGRHINDRVHANIQNDGTFSIVPRSYGGVTSPEQLRKVADVAEKYNARMIKITGSQRLDILGVKKEDLPKAWEDLDMPSGFAYTKAFRQVKSCVGTEFCRYGVGDSTKLAIDMEKEFENLYTPAKVKMGASGCPRNCAESSVKDIGVIAIEGGWQIFVGGAAGMEVRKGDVIATVNTEEEAKNVMMAFMQFYRENGHYKERTYDFVPRIGLDNIRAVVLDESSGEPEQLRERLREAKAATSDPWLERRENATKNQFVGAIGRK